MLLQHSRVCDHPQATCPHLKTETFLFLVMSYLQRELLMNGYTLDLPRCFHLRQQVLPVKMRSWIQHLLLLSSVLQLLPSSEWEHSTLTKHRVKAVRKVILHFPSLGEINSCALQPICHRHYAKGAVHVYVPFSTKHTNNSNTGRCH